MNANSLNKAIDVALDEDRVASNWKAIDRKIVLKAVRRRYSTGAIIASAVTACAVLVWFELRKDEHLMGAVQSDTSPKTVVLAEGSQLQLEAFSRIDPCQGNPGDACVSVSYGTARFSVVPRMQGRFVVRAGEAEVRAVGTEFSVAHHADPQGRRVSVFVQSGVVEVSVSGGAPRRLGAGETWSEQLERSSRVLDGGQKPDQQGTSNGSVDAQEGAASSSDPTPTPATSSNVPKPTSSKGALETEETLRERARAARLSGDVQVEARAYEQLIATFPTSPSAGLATFELARLRMDVLGDQHGAIVLLERLSRAGGPLGEDTLARLATAYARVGRSADCSRSKSLYESKYPNGPHKAALQGLCP